jgi:hypothetical protein
MFRSVAGSAQLVSFLVLLTVAVAIRAFEGVFTRFAVRVVCALFTVAPWADACLIITAFAQIRLLGGDRAITARVLGSLDERVLRRRETSIPRCLAMATQMFIGLLETLAEFACSRANRVSTLHPVFGFGCKRTRVLNKYPKTNKRQNLKLKNQFFISFLICSYSYTQYLFSSILVQLEKKVYTDRHSF